MIFIDIIIPALLILFIELVVVIWLTLPVLKEKYGKYMKTGSKFIPLNSEITKKQNIKYLKHKRENRKFSI